jgi:hypothetical protein
MISEEIEKERFESREVKIAGRAHRQGRSRIGIAKFHWPAAPTAVLCSTQYGASYEGGHFPRLDNACAQFSYFYTL